MPDHQGPIAGDTVAKSPESSQVVSGLSGRERQRTEIGPYAESRKDLVRGVLWRVAAVSLGGLGLAVAFPPYGIWALAPVAVAVLTVAVLGRRPLAGLGYGFIFGVVFFGVLLRWISVIGDDAWLALVVFSATWIGFVGWATVLVTRLRGWPWWVAVVWVASEALRDRIPLGGWPWGRLAFSQGSAPTADLAWLGGAPLLTFAASMAGGLLAWSWFLWPEGGRTKGIVGTTGALGVMTVGLLVPLDVAGESDGGRTIATVAIVQGDVPTTGPGFGAQDSEEEQVVLANHVAETGLLSQEVQRGDLPQPDVVIWPENASDIDPYRDRATYEAISSSASGIGAPILVGAVVENPEDPSTLLNQGIVWEPDVGATASYSKQHPVPFGEYIPFRDFLEGRIGRLDQIPRDFAPGTANGVLQLGAVRLGDVICFEIAYDDLVKETVLDGARLLAVQTNNATYTGSGESPQQLAMARIRAIEHGRSVAVAATNGLSALFLPDGTQVATLAESTSGNITAKVPLRDSLTPSDRVGLLPEALAFLLTGVLVVLGFRQPRTAAQRGQRRCLVGGR